MVLGVAIGCCGGGPPAVGVTNPVGASRVLLGGTAGFGWGHGAPLRVWRLCGWLGG